jgi:lysyl-tRNA synthetase class 2
MTEQLSFDKERLEFENMRLEQFKKFNIDPYQKFAITCSFDEYIKKYSHLESGNRSKDIIECIAGRVIEKRTSGKNLVFYTVQSK